MDYLDLIAELKKKEFRPVYFLFGSEPYFTDEVTRFFERKALSESEQAFNQTVIYGKDASAQAIVDTATRYPMMAPYQVVILKEAQEMDELDKLASYIQKPTPTTILIIAHKPKKNRKFNLNSAFGKILKKHAYVFEAKPVYENKMPDWITRYLKRKKLSINAVNAALIAEYLGMDLSKVANELDKLALNLKPGIEVNGHHIEENIGISREYNTFELQKALGLRDAKKITRIVQYFVANPKDNPLQMVTALLYNFFHKVYMMHFVKGKSDKEIMSTLGLRNTFALKEQKIASRNFSRRQSERVISLLREYDLRSKGVENTSTPDTELLREMIWKIMHV